MNRKDSWYLIFNIYTSIVLVTTALDFIKKPYIQKKFMYCFKVP